MAQQTSVIEAAVRGRRLRTLRRSWWADGLEIGVWFAASTGIAFMFLANGLAVTETIVYVHTGARALGIVAAVLMMSQVLLASRAPWVERALGHDRAMLKHTKFGKVAIVLMLVHVVLMTTMEARESGSSLVEQSLAWAREGDHMLLAQIAIALFALVLVTSLVAVRRRWKYERWHAVHLVVYVAVGFAVPHQFIAGGTFDAPDSARWYWAALYVISFGSFIAFRIVRPLWMYARYQVEVAAVTTLPDGSTTVEFAGKGLERLGARPGQFFLWRFMQAGHRGQAHPYSLSAAPGGALRITVKPSGDGSSSVRDIKPGTRVLIEGPLGVFTDDARTGHEVLLVAAGIGVTPIRSMLESAAPEDEVTVVIRARSREEAPLLDEVEELAKARGATVHVLLGSRGDTWGTAGQPASVASFVSDPRAADVFVCGPRAWALSVAKDALAAGVSPDAIHREEFAW